MPKRTTLLSILLFVVSLLSTAHAQPNQQLWHYGLCQPDFSNLFNNAETFALGNIRGDAATIDEGNDYLGFYTAVFPALCVLDESYVTQFPHSVQAIGIQMGSSIDVAEEWAVWVDIMLPPPSTRIIKLPVQQYDKHWANGPGNRNIVFNIKLDLPAGTTIRIRRPAVVCLGIPARTVVNPNPATPNDYGPYSEFNCITGQAVTLVGTTL